MNRSRFAPDSSAVVTGAAQGIGRGIVEELIDQGWLVVGLDRDASALTATAGELGSRFLPHLGSVTQRADLERAADLAQSAAPLRGWVNNAGVERPTMARALDEPIMREIVEVNLIGVLLGCAVAVERLLKAPPSNNNGWRGAVVNISSIHAVAGFPDSFVYASTKGAIDALTRQLAIDEGAHGIRVNSVRPGAVMTPLTQRFLDAAPDPSALLAEYAELHPQQRLIEPREVGAAVAFLLGEASAMISGQCLGVDGGASARVFAYPSHG